MVFKGQGHFAKHLQLHPSSGLYSCASKNKVSTWPFSSMIEEVSLTGFSSTYPLLTYGQQSQMFPVCLPQGAKAQNVVVVYFRRTLLIHSYLNSGRNICGSTSTDSTFSCWTMSFIRAGKLMWAILWRIGGYQLWSTSQRGYATW